MDHKFEIYSHDQANGSSVEDLNMQDSLPLLYIIYIYIYWSTNQLAKVYYVS